MNNNLITYKTSQIEESSKVFANINKPKISKPIMTIYEFNQIIGLRTMQLSMGAIPFVKTNIIKSNMELREVAIQELKEGKLPFIIKRPLPNNKFEYVRIRELDFAKVKYML